MTSASIGSQKSQNETKPSLVESSAKKTVLSMLRKLEIGHLSLTDGCDTYHFGQHLDDTKSHGHINVHHQSMYRDIILSGSIGAGESYIRGAWSSSDLVGLVRVFCQNISHINKIDQSRPLYRRLATGLFHLLNANSLSGSKKNIAAHYDLGNSFFELFLDKTMMYSSAVFPNTNASLEEAASHKLDLICQKLNLSETDHLLEIGTGWGGMAIHAASKYGCRVTTTTISRQQYEYAQKAVRSAGLEDKITLLLEDYRELTGTYSKLVSIEMIEAVGHKQYPTYFSQCSKLLENDGLMCIQAITINDQRYQSSLRSVDFIQRYIFPGGCLPSNEVIATSVSKYTDMQVVSLQDIGLHYAETLASWKSRFERQLNAVKEQGFDDDFIRMWDFYLSYCEGAFRERCISTAHFVFAKPKALLGS